VRIVAGTMLPRGEDDVHPAGRTNDSQKEAKLSIGMASRERMCCHVVTLSMIVSRLLYVAQQCLDGSA
jgi:hypothetical protein